MADKVNSKLLSSLCLYVGLNTKFLFTLPIFMAPKGPFHGILETAKAKEAAIILKVSGSFSPSKDKQVTITCISFLKSFGNKGLTARSIIRDNNIASYEGLDSLFKNREPKIFPAA